MKKENKNAKDPGWQVPVDLPSVKPEDYDSSIDSANGSAHTSKKNSLSKPKKKYRYLDSNS